VFENWGATTGSPKLLTVNHPSDESGYWAEIWPIGSVYLSVNDVDPGSVFGFGTWQAYGVGSLLIGATGPTRVNSVATAPASVTTTPIPTAAVFCWQRIA
jgi:hypothetical protein